LERLALIARLLPGAEGRAEEVIAAGPPFDPEGSGFSRHSVFLSATEVVFVFEGHEVEWIVDDLVEGQFLHPILADALAEWRSLIEGQPRIAREKFFWERAPGG
jgi:hypothetical protein